MHKLALYLKERENVDSLITEKGFATYVINGDECYIRDIYTHKDFRKKGEAADLADQIAIIAKREGCKYLTGSVCPTVSNATISLKVLLAYGFELNSCIQNIIFFRKEL